MSITRYRNKLYVLVGPLEVQIGVKYHTLVIWWHGHPTRLVVTVP